MAAGISSAMAAEIGETSTVQGGTVEFKGSVVDAACAVTADSTNQVVTMDQVRMQAFTGKDSVANQKNRFPSNWLTATPLSLLRQRLRLTATQPSASRAYWTTSLALAQRQA